MRSRTHPTFFDRFLHLALNYLNTSRSCTHYQVSSIIAPQLLVNAKTPPSFFLLISMSSFIILILIKLRLTLFPIRILGVLQRFPLSSMNLSTLLRLLSLVLLRPLPLLTIFLLLSMHLPLSIMYLCQTPTSRLTSRA